MSLKVEISLETAVKMVAEEGFEVIAFFRVPADKIHNCDGAIYAQQSVVDIILAKAKQRNQ